MRTEFSVAIAIRDNELWRKLDCMMISQAMDWFGESLSFHTRRTYLSYLKKVFSGQFCPLRLDSSVQTLALSNLENVLDTIKKNTLGSEATKQLVCKAFISFTKFLERQTKGMVKKAIPQCGINATFPTIRDKCATKALKMDEWNKFIKALREVSFRDYLIAKALFQGAKRISEVLSAQIEDIDWEKRTITYKQLKSKILEKKTCITYPESFMKELKVYLNNRVEGAIFVTRNGKPVTQPQLHRNFAYASIKSNLPFKVHPHVLRATAITHFMRLGYHSDDIMKISGHANTKDVLFYDKSPIDENITKEVCLI